MVEPYLHGLVLNFSGRGTTLPFYAKTESGGNAGIGAFRRALTI
jgi:hypothetical protein